MGCIRRRRTPARRAREQELCHARTAVAAVLGGSRPVPVIGIEHCPESDTCSCPLPHRAGRLERHVCPRGETSFFPSVEFPREDDIMLRSILCAAIVAAATMTADAHQ